METLLGFIYIYVTWASYFSNTLSNLISATCHCAAWVSRSYLSRLWQARMLRHNIFCLTFFLPHEKNMFYHHQKYDRSKHVALPARKSIICSRRVEQKVPKLNGNCMKRTQYCDWPSPNTTKHKNIIISFETGFILMLWLKYAIDLLMFDIYCS